MSLLHPPQRGSNGNVVFLDVTDDSDTVYLGTDVWDELHIYPDIEEIDGKLSVLIAPTQDLQAFVVTSGQKSPFRYLLANAVIAPSTSNLTGDDIGVPTSWKTRYPVLFPDSTHFSPFLKSFGHRVFLVANVELLEVYIMATSFTALEYTKSHTDDFEAWLTQDRRVIRNGDKRFLPAPDDSGALYGYEIVITEPTLQGYIKPDLTRIIAVCKEDAPEVDIPSDEQAEEEVEIDENFLANFSLNTTLSHPSDSPEQGTNGSSSSLKAISISPSGQQLRAVPLPHPHPAPYDIGTTVFVRTRDLPRFGVLSGDWALASTPDFKNQHLVRVIACSNPESILLTSPTLIHNICQRNEPSIVLCSTPFGQQSPPVPTAKTVTLARVASPESVNRKFQALFLYCLQDYLCRHKRLLKKGDIISIHVDVALASVADDIEAISEDARPKNVRYFGAFDDCIPNAAVHFLVTNLEHDVIKTDNNITVLDTYTSALMGELGCWIDPGVTRVVQAGVEHSFIPEFLDINAELPGQAPYCEMDAEDDSSVFNELLNLFTVLLNPDTVEKGFFQTYLLIGPRGVGKATTVRRIASKLGINCFENNCFEILNETDVKTKGTMKARFEQAFSMSPCIMLLTLADAFSMQEPNAEKIEYFSIFETLSKGFAELQAQWKETGYPTIVVATTDNPEGMPEEYLKMFKWQFRLEVPDQKERRGILNTLLQFSHVSPDVEMDAAARGTAAFLPSDLVDVVDRAEFISRGRVVDYAKNRDQELYTAEILETGTTIVSADLETALSESRAQFAANIGAPRIPNVAWEDVGGLAHVKKDILDVIQLPLDHPELFQGGLKQRSGILLWGPPGTGKTMLAKAVATSCALNFLSVKGPELLNMYIGESEANVRKIFQRARDAKPCVIFFDELDSLAPKRGSKGDSGGVMDRIVSQLLTEMDGMSSNTGNVFVIAATNRPDLIDPALLRPGRFDKLIYLGIPDTHEAQYDIIAALTRNFELADDVDLHALANSCPFNYTGADFYALCADAMQKAMSRIISKIETKIDELNNAEEKNPDWTYPITPKFYMSNIATAKETDPDIIVSQADFEEALGELPSSVSPDEVAHYLRIKRKFEGRDESEENETTTREQYGIGEF